MSREFAERLKFLKYFFLVVFLIFVVKLFSVQVMEHDYYAAEAKAQHEKRSVLPARRGRILVRKNRHTEETTPLATNNTLKMLYVDPLLLSYPKYDTKTPLNEQERGNPVLAAQLLAPILINAQCEKIEGCEINTNPEEWSAVEAATIAAYQEELATIFNQIEVDRVVIDTNLANSTLVQIRSLGLAGIFIEEEMVIANPTLIADPAIAAKALGDVLNLNKEKLEYRLTRRYRRYQEITRKIVPEVSAEIEKIKKIPQYRDVLRGIALQDEYWRYYPERKLASQTLGFVDSSGNGQYGMEGRFDHELRGKEGFIFGATTTTGQRIVSGDNLGLIHAQDGADILLTIDRVLQGEVERILAEDLQTFDADFGQVIVMNPQNGHILAMAHAPSFDPNEFGQVYSSYEITPEQEDDDRLDEEFNQRIETMQVDGKYYRYYNDWGPRVFQNKVVTDTYEPGSVVKAFTIAAAINASEITPATTYDDYGPVEVEEFEIGNSEDVYNGAGTSMLTVLQKSLNTGIAFITQKMGSQVMYEYLRNFGFDQYTDVELDGENPGKLEFWKDWSPSELVTRGFGQGFTATPLQVVTAFSALANGGYLMKPILVEEIRYSDGTVQVMQPEIIRRVVSGKTAETVKAMLLSTIDKELRRSRVAGHTVMGKSGTSQTYRNGKPLEGEGTTIASFAGFGPVNDPRFVVLVKYDYPRTSQWGSSTAGLTFQRIMEYGFNHYDIPPDR